jgi:cytochrome c oxidase cbb3-type subunit 2
MAENAKPRNFQERMEINIWLLLVILAIALSVGGIVEIVPLFTMKSTMEYNKFPEIVWQHDVKSDQRKPLSQWKAGDGIRPYKAIELAGRDIYQREGCYTCHSQMIRPFRDERERYGHYSLASESMFDHPFQWGSKRTGPDLARVGGKYSDDWQRGHLRAPRSLVPESVMPNYPWLDNAVVDPSSIQAHMRGMRAIGVPYSDADIAAATTEVAGKTEMDALVAYLQVLGTMVKLKDDVAYRE